MEESSGNYLPMNIELGRNKLPTSSVLDQKKSQNKSLQAYGKVERQFFNSQIETSTRTNQKAQKSPDKIYNNMIAVNHYESNN